MNRPPASADRVRPVTADPEGMARLPDDDAASKTLEDSDVLGARLTDLDLVAAASHEMRGPLTILVGYLELLTDRYGELDDAQRTNFIARALRAAHKERDILDLLLESARFGSSRPDVRCLDHSLRPVIEDALVDFEEVMDVGISIDVPDDLRVLVDAVALDRVIANLVTNASKYSRPEPSIIVSARRRNGEVVVDVTDNGPGVPTSEQDQIFEPFHRSRPAETRGVGLGLAVARRLIEAMDGRLWVEDAMSGGARFRFSIPAPPGAEEPRPRNRGR